MGDWTTTKWQTSTVGCKSYLRQFLLCSTEKVEVLGRLAYRNIILYSWQEVNHLYSNFLWKQRNTNGDSWKPELLGGASKKYPRGLKPHDTLQQCKSKQWQSFSQVKKATSRSPRGDDDVCVFSHVWLFFTSWTVACQAPLSMEFSRQEYWSGLSFPIPGDLPDPGIEPESLLSPTFQADSLPLGHLGSRHQVKCYLAWTPKGMLWGVSRNPRST